MNRLHVIGIGNAFRSDDGVGVRVIDHLSQQYPAHCHPGFRLTKSQGDVAGLVEALAASERVVIVDALNDAGLAQPGEAIRIHLDTEHSLVEEMRASTHSLGIAEAIELARVLQCLPEQLTLWGIVGRDFSIGEALSPEVAAAASEIAEVIWSDYVEDDPAQESAPSV